MKKSSKKAVKKTSKKSAKKVVKKVVTKVEKGKSISWKAFVSKIQNKRIGIIAEKLFKSKEEQSVSFVNIEKTSVTFMSSQWKMGFNDIEIKKITQKKDSFLVNLTNGVTLSIRAY